MDEGCLAWIPMNAQSIERLKESRESKKERDQIKALHSRMRKDWMPNLTGRVKRRSE